MADTLTHLDYREAMRVDLPCIDSDGVKVSRRTITEEQARRSQTHAFLSGGRGRVNAGDITQITVDGTLWMSDTPDEKRDHAHVFWEAQRRGGRILVHGLGIGMILQSLLLLDKVEHVDVVEYDERIIRLIGSVYAERFPGKVTFHHGDAYTYRFPPGTRWSMAWHDIWPTITGDNWEGMNRLHRRYGNRVGWQDSWMRDAVRRSLQSDRRYPW